jgi:hypothetical protein
MATPPKVTTTPEVGLYVYSQLSSSLVTQHQQHPSTLTKLTAFAAVIPPKFKQMAG